MALQWGRETSPFQTPLHLPSTTRIAASPVGHFGVAWSSGGACPRVGDLSSGTAGAASRRLLRWHWWDARDSFRRLICSPSSRCWRDNPLTFVKPRSRGKTPAYGHTYARELLRHPKRGACPGCAYECVTTVGHYASTPHNPTCARSPPQAMNRPSGEKTAALACESSLSEWAYRHSPPSVLSTTKAPVSAPT